jgi:hypothetical protein
VTKDCPGLEEFFLKEETEEAFLSFMSNVGDSLPRQKLDSNFYATI